MPIAAGASNVDVVHGRYYHYFADYVTALSVSHTGSVASGVLWVTLWQMLPSRTRQTFGFEYGDETMLLSITVEVTGLSSTLI